MRRPDTVEPDPKNTENFASAAKVSRIGDTPLPTIAVATRKGGTGKTTLAVHLALAAHLRGLKVVLADADPQRSASEVLRGRVGAGPRHFDTSVLDLETIQARAAASAADLLVIDTPGGPGPILREALPIADLVLLVSRPTFLDIAAAVRTQAEARAMGVQTVIVLNQAPPMRSGAETTAVDSVLEALRTNKLAVSPAIVRSRTAFQTSMAAGRSVEELGASPAAADVAALWDDVRAMLDEARGGDGAFGRPTAAAGRRRDAAGISAAGFG